MRGATDDRLALGEQVSVSQMSEEHCLLTEYRDTKAQVSELERRVEDKSQ
jgi:hypothetical protein